MKHLSFLLLLIIFSCGGKLSDEQRKKLKERMEEGKNEIIIFELIKPEKFKAIVEVIKKLETTLYGPVRQQLGEEYTYSEIRLAMNNLDKVVA